MNVVDMQETHNQLLSRKDIKAILGFEAATPSRESLVQFFGTKFNTKPELIVIRNVKTMFGNKHCMVEAHIYDSDKAKTVENAHQIWRSFGKDKRKEAMDAKKAAKKSKKKDVKKAASGAKKDKK